MKNFLFSICILSLFISCKEHKPSTTPKENLSVSQKIANAHGFKHWKDVSKIKFTFNVDKDSSHFERSWAWEPKIDQVTLYKRDTVINYNRSNIDSSFIQIDKQFINDKYWLLVPFQLMWDKGLTVTEPVTALTPISKKKMNKITMQYSNVGGYTPSDAYDIFFEDDYIIKEWVFRKGNSDNPTLTNTFEDYKNINGIRLATKHRKTDSNWNLNFTNIEIIPQN